MITTLIDKQDSFEIMRDQIAAILKLETSNQQTLATAAAKDPNLWKLRIFSERSNPWQQFDDLPADTSPLVNVTYEDSNFDASGSNIMERQKTTGVFNIDCYGYGVSSDNIAGGHNPGDQVAALEVQRALRLVRNILMAAEYTYLGLRGQVWQRWIRTIQTFQPQLENQQANQIVGARISFQVIFNEFSPQVALETLELVSLDVFRAETGEILLEADYAYPI